jgi:hypothetical protein
MSVKHSLDSVVTITWDLSFETYVIGSPFALMEVTRHEMFAATVTNGPSESEDRDDRDGF